ncbi:IclR family transcriptional regulator [Comamonas humi]
MKKHSDPAAPAIAAEPAPGRRQRVQAAQTCVVVLKALAQLGGRASLTAVAQSIGENPAKVHRYLASLMDEGLVAQDPNNQLYALGLESIRVGLAAMRQCDPVRVAEPALLHLRDALSVTCLVAVMGNLGPTIVRIEEPALPVTVNARVGSVLPMLWSATGRAFFAFAPDAGYDHLLQQEWREAPAARRAQLDADDPLGRLREQVRAAGCASVCDTNLPGISAVAAPLLDYTGRVAAVLCALGASGGFDPDPRGAIAQAVIAAAADASRQLGAGA